MKRLVQVVAVAIIAVLAGLPAVQGLACSMHMGDRASACPMGMSEMGPDCPMARGMAASCDMGCCNQAFPRIAAALASPTKPKAVPVAAVAALVAVTAIAAASEARTIEPSVAASPPRYLLNQVFRI